MESTEALLVQQLKNGVDAAYKYLYDQHYQILCHVAAQYVKDDFLAETIVGDVICWRCDIPFMGGTRDYRDKHECAQLSDDMRTQSLYRLFEVAVS